MANAVKWCVAAMLILLAGAGAPRARGEEKQAEPAAVNLLKNGGFENWAAIKEGDPKRTPRLVDNMAPVGWWVGQDAYERQKNPDFPVETSITADKEIKHGGEMSARLDSALTTDIVELSLPPFPIQPKHTYIVRGWVRGRDVKRNRDGAGVVVWTNFGPKDKYWEGQKSVLQRIPKEGTFDWTPFEYRLTAADNDGQFRIVLQVRRASGTVWFDDVEIVDAADEPKKAE